MLEISPDRLAEVPKPDTGMAADPPADVALAKSRKLVAEHPDNGPKLK